MTEKVVGDLVKARAALKQKLRTLKADIARSQREIDIQYAPISEPLKEIAQKLDTVSLKEPDKKDLSASLIQSMTEFMPEKYDGPIPGTSIISRSTPSKFGKRVSWFSPGISSSPTKKTKLGIYSITKQPTFLEDEYIGELIPETSTSITDADSREEEYESGESLDLDKSMAHALSLLRTKPSKSIITNKSINKTLLDADVVKEALEHHDPTIRPYLIGLMTDENDEYDSKYGVREEDGKLKLGNVEVAFEDSNIIIGEFTYKATKGLLELLFKKKPGKFSYTDAKNFKYILNNTNVHRVGYDKNRKISVSVNNEKYKNIIKPILDGRRPTVWWARTWKTGLGLHKTLIPNTKLEYKYWDDVNELCDRLKLLIASKNAGHTGHDNEILAIIEELQEANIIEN